MNLLSRRKATRGQNEITTPLCFLCHHETYTTALSPMSPSHPSCGVLHPLLTGAARARLKMKKKKSCGFRGCAVPSALLLRGTNWSPFQKIKKNYMSWTRGILSMSGFSEDEEQMNYVICGTSCSELECKPSFQICRSSISSQHDFPHPFPAISLRWARGMAPVSKVVVVRGERVLVSRLVLLLFVLGVARLLHRSYSYLAGGSR